MRKFLADPESAESLNIEAYSDADRLFRSGRYRDALRLFQDAVHADPSDGLAHLALGNCWDALRKPKRAESSYRTAAELLPEAERSSAIYNLANALYDQGQYQEAVRLYRQVPKGTTTWELARRNLALAVKHLDDEG